MTVPTLPLEGKRNVLLAVSGGSDSTALLLLAVRQSRQITNPPKLTAVTIDHALRSGSAGEAAKVGELCARLGVDHITCTWKDEKPTSGIQAAARDARRMLIAQVAVERGADVVLTGHTLDDQRETVSMRARRGGGPGLAGIAPSSMAYNDVGKGEPVWFSRPLLQTRRQELRDFLTGERMGWVDDPSNDNVDFERVAMRRHLATVSNQDLSAIDVMQQAAAQSRIAIAGIAARLLTEHAFSVAPGLCHVERAFFDGGGTDASLTAMRALMAFAAGTAFMADSLHAKVLFETAERHFRLAGAKAEQLGAGGVLADIRADGVYLMQERRLNSLPKKDFAGRYRLLGADAGVQGESAVNREVRSAPASLVRHAQLSEPVFACPDHGAMAPREAIRRGLRLRLLLNPWPDLVPSFDLLLAQSLANMVGIAPLPERAP